MIINELNEIKNEEGKQNYRFVTKKDYGRNLLKLTLIKERECEGKEYDLYIVCKVEDNGIEEPDFIPLYKETFTPAQVEQFYNPPVRRNKYTAVDKLDDENLSLLDIMPGDFNIEDDLIENLIEIYD